MHRPTFYMATENEAHAWLFRCLTRAGDVMRDIHTDMARGFVRAGVVAYDALLESELWDAAGKQGALRLEGKAYPVQDGDVLLIRFNMGRGPRDDCQRGVHGPV